MTGKLLSKRGRNNTFKDNDKEILFSELLSLLSGGLDFSRAFLLLISGEKSQKKKTLAEIYDKMVAGANLWQSMESS
ncbi:MAG: type II secretion system F family protein, partial [Rikenellaceae bacterium]|nr:type II secretion system F family protein [Rikenellaceae bacterium]